MKYIWIVLSLSLLSCTPQKITTTLKKHSEIRLGNNATLKFDEIAYYKLDSSFNVKKLNRRNLSELNILRKDVILGNTPKTPIDTIFVKSFEKMSYKRIALDTIKYSKIANIYNYSSKKYDTPCVKIFNNILVFKNHNRIVGISKICFGCIYNSTFLGDSFYRTIMIDDYEELEAILK